jgi:chemotaxis protein histidine kinase CheA
VNGDVVIESEPGAGTTVRASAPLRTTLLDVAPAQTSRKQTNVPPVI